jgi:Fungal specific transcription factor domain
MDGAYHHKIIDHALDHPSLKTLQALAILALSYVASGSTERLLGVVAILTRLAMSLSLHNMDSFPQCEDNPKYTSTRVSLIETEEHRRCFWAIYVLDQFASASSGCPISQWRKKIQTDLPCLEAEFQMSRDSSPHHRLQKDPEKVKVDAWAYCVESAGVLGRVAEWIQANLDGSNVHGRSIAKQLEEWWIRLPESVRLPKHLTKNDAGNLILLHASYNTYLFSYVKALI